MGNFCSSARKSIKIWISKRNDRKYKLIDHQRSLNIQNTFNLLGELKENLDILNQPLDTSKENIIYL